MSRPKKNTDLPDFCEAWKGLVRVRVQVPAPLVPTIGQRNLYKSTGLPVGTKRAIAQRIAQPIIDQFHDRIEAARPEPTVWVHRQQAHRMSIPELGNLALSPATIDQISKLIRAEHPEGVSIISRGGAGTGLMIEVPASVAARMQTAEPAMPLAGITFAATVDHWQEVNNGTPEETRAYHRMLRRLGATIGHDDANRVTPAEIIRHEEHLRKDGLSQKTISNHLKGFRVVFRTAKEKLKIDQNPMTEIRIREGKGNERLDFTPAERDRILLAARDAADPVIKWCNLLAGFGGMRLEEIAEMDSRDVRIEDGVAVFDIRPEHRLEASPNRKIKNSYSVRQVPVHTAIAADFLAFVESIRAEYGEGLAKPSRGFAEAPQPLFPMLKPDQDGRLSDAAGKRINPWLRETCGIDHPMKSFHSWRHTVSSMLDKIPATKGALAHQLTGHAPPDEAAKYKHYTLPEKAVAIDLLANPFAAEKAASGAA
jgi:integrase